MESLIRLRIFFIIYFIIKMVIDISLLASNLLVKAKSIAGISTGSLLVVTLAVDLILFFIGLWLFSSLLEKKNWVRILLIVIGWLAVVDFISSTLFMSEGLKILNRIYGDMDWGNLLFVDVVGDTLAAIFWGYTIYLLQFNDKVRDLLNYAKSAVHGPKS